MTKRQAELINIMFSQHYNSATYKDAYGELLLWCDVPTVATGTTTPTVTVTTGTTPLPPPPPSTPKPLGPEWWKERQDEALQEQIDIIADQNKKIAELQKQIAEDNWHSTIKAGIDKACREQANELVLTNKEIIYALRHWGLRNEGSLVSNVKHVIQLCAERGKEHFEQKDKIERLNDQIDSQSKVIAELTNQRDQWEKLAAKRSDEMNRRSDMIDIMEKQGDRKDKEIKALKATCDIRQGFIDKGREVSDELRKQLMEKSAEIEELKKDRNASIIASNQILGALNQTSLRQYDGSLADNVVDVIKQCVAQEKKIEILDKENYRLEKHIENLKSFSRDDQEINHRKTVEIEGLKKQLAVAGKKRQAIVEAGSRLRDRLRIMSNQYFMPQCEHTENSNAIALWEDNTTP